jgi:hypothetical protein
MLYASISPWWPPIALERMKINRACTCSKQVNPKLRIGDHRLLHTTSDFSSLSEAAA